MPQITYIDTGKHRERERPTLCPRLLRGVIRYRVPILIFMAFFRLIGLSFSEMQQWDESVYALRVQVLLQYGDMWDQSPHMLSGLRYATQPPLFVWLSAASVLLFHDALWAYRLPAALAGALLVLLLYRFAREHLPPGHALAVAGLFAFSPLPVFFSRQAQPETVIALCLLAALWLVLRAIRLRRRIFAVPAGLALGAALLTKSAVALVLPVSVVIAAVFLSPAARRRTWTAAVLMTLVSLPVWLPWAWMMTDAHGKGDALWMFAAAVSSGGGWSGLDGLLRESGGMRLSHPATMQLLILLPFAAVFIWNALVINRRVQWVLVAVTLVCSVAVLWLLQLRIEILLIPILPLLCFAAVQGAVSARALGQQRSSRRLRGLLSLPVLFGVTLCFAVLSMWDIWLVDPGKHRDGAEHCAAIARASDAERILLIGSGDNPQLTFYFGGADIGWVEEDYLRYERLEPHALGADAIRARASGYADSLRVLLLIEHDEIMRGVSRRAEDLMPENFSIRLRTVRYSIATPPGVRLP